VRNPWSGQQAEVVDGSTGTVVVSATTASTLSVPVTAGQTYLVQRPSAPTTSLPFARVTGTPARTNRSLGNVTIGLSGNSLPTGNTVTVTNPGNQTSTLGTAIAGVQVQATDSASGQTLTYTAAGLPAGLSISSSGLISGTPTAAGTFTATITASDTTGASGSATFTWKISDPTSGNTVTVTNPGDQTSTAGTPIPGVQVHATDSASGQTLTYTATGLPTGLSINSSGLISGTPTTAGTSTVTITATDTTGASGSTTFTWTVNGSTVLRSVASNRCLDVPNRSTTDGTQVAIWDCNGGTNQLWTPTASKQLTVYGTKCLEVAGQSTTAGAAADIATCTGATNQQWNLNSNGTITSVQSGLCLDVTGAATANGTKVEVWTCNSGTNQSWTRS
jgi:hypothetical protein